MDGLHRGKRQHGRSNKTAHDGFGALG
jgi:hypothetical protein